MTYANPSLAPAHSPLMLCDRLIGLAQDADRAGFAATADRLIGLVDRMFAERKRQTVPRARPNRSDPGEAG